MPDAPNDDTTILGFSERKKAYHNRADLTSFELPDPAEQLKVPPPSSEDRLDKLGIPDSAPRGLPAALQKLRTRYSLSTRILTPSHLPDLNYERGFKYYCEYDDLQRLLTTDERAQATAVMEDEEVAGFGIALQKTTTEADVEIICVDHYSTRSSGLMTGFEYKGEAFSVGIAQQLVWSVCSRLTGMVRVDATNAASRFAFKLCGFHQQPNTDNPCLLEMDAGR